MDGTFLDGHDELYHCAKFREGRTMLAGCRCENVMFVFCLFFIHRQDAAKRQTAGIKFTHRTKNQVFRPAGATRCTNSPQTWQGRRSRGSAWLYKILPQSAQGWECGPRNIKKFPLFGKVSPRPLTDFPLSGVFPTGCTEKLAQLADARFLSNNSVTCEANHVKFETLMYHT